VSRKSKQKHVKLLKRGKVYSGVVNSFSNSIKSPDAMTTPFTLMKPGNPKTTVTNYPTIIISEEAHRDISILVHQVATEVGWFNLVHWTPEGNLYISDIMVPKQRCHGATTELTTDGISELFTKLMSEDAAAGIPDAQGRRHRVRCWGHSHVHGPVSPSGQDDNQMRDFGVMGVELMIRSIHNKSGSSRYDVFYYRENKTWIQFNDVEWKIDTKVDAHGERVKEIAELVESNVKGFDSPVRVDYAQARIPGADHLYGGWNPHTRREVTPSFMGMYGVEG